MISYNIPLFHPLTQQSRLQMMSSTEAIVKIPEGQTLLSKG